MYLIIKGPILWKNTEVDTRLDSTPNHSDLLYLSPSPRSLFSAMSLLLCDSCSVVHYTL